MGSQISKDGSSVDHRRRKKPLPSLRVGKSCSRTSSRLDDASSTSPVSPARHQLPSSSDHTSPLSSLSSVMAVPIQHRRSRMKHSGTHDDCSSIASDASGTQTSRSAYCSSSVGSVTSTQTSPTQIHFLSRDGSVTFDSKSSFESTLPSPVSPHTKFDRRECSIYDYASDKEYDRQLRQHYVLKQVFGGNIQVPLKQPAKILDSACGAGVWTLEVAQAYPNSKVMGLDLNPPNSNDNTRPNGSRLGGRDQAINGPNAAGTLNISYAYGDILMPLSLDNNSFDLIYQRDVATAVPFKHWQNLLGEYYRILQPGGYLQLVEYDMLFENPGPVLAQINESFKMAAGTLGLDPSYTSLMKDMLAQAGFTEVEEVIHDIPIGEWHENKTQKQHGFLYMEQMKLLFRSMRRWWMTETGISSSEYDRVCTAALDEFENEHITSRWRIFTARKPLTN